MKKGKAKGSVFKISNNAFWKVLSPDYTVAQEPNQDFIQQLIIKMQSMFQ
jgi:hypothetical protein